MVIVFVCINLLLLIFLSMKINVIFRLLNSIYARQHEYHQLHNERLTTLIDHMRNIEKALFKVKDDLSRTWSTVDIDSFIKPQITPLEREIKSTYDLLWNFIQKTSEKASKPKSKKSRE